MKRQPLAIKATAIILTALFILVIASRYISAIDAPHNASNMNCGSCHGYEIFWVGTGSYNALCQGCHKESSCPPEGYPDTNAPAAKTHADSNGNELAECRTCHDPHYQRQKNYKSADPGNYYLAKGQFTACSAGSGTSTLTYSSPITYKTGWDATKLTGKTDICRRTILFPNVNKLGYSYPIIGVDEGANTITVKGNACEFLYLFPSNFAVIYGQYIKDSILINEITGTYSPVKFFDKIGSNSFADGDNTYNSVCEVCHTKTTHFRNNGGGDDPLHTNISPLPARTNCIICHPHTEGFKPSCNACHGYPPPPLATSGAGSTGSTTEGAHILHATTKGYQCSMCHYNSVGSGTTHNNNIITLGFVNLPGAHTGGSYDGQISVNYQRSDLGTTVTKNGSKECSNIYCHGSTMAPNGGTDITPIWDQASTGACGTCHGATPANPPTSGSHSIHAGSEQLVCSKCHNNYESMHVDGGVHIEPGSGVSFVPGDGSCSNISCHSNTEAEWGNSACLKCHSISINNRAAITPQFIPTLIDGKYTASSHHIQLPQGVPLTGAHCYQCHWEANSDGTINGLYHGGSKAPGSAVDLVIYGSGGSRPTGMPYTSGVTGIAYVADGDRSEIRKLNAHCLGCHNTQNNTTTPFAGDIHTPNQYAWDGTSIGERYSQTGITKWGKYRSVFIDESFEGSGYEETWTEVVGSPDEDSPIPGTPPPNAGSQCLKSIGSMAYTRRDLGSEQPKTFTSFYLYVESENLTNGSDKIIGALLDNVDNRVFALTLSKFSGQLVFKLQLYNDSTTYYAPLSLNAWYQIDIKYDNIDDTWEWRVNGVTKNSGSLPAWHCTGIQKWLFGFMYTQPITGTIYFDLVKVNNESWDEFPGGKNVTPKDTQTKAYSAHGNATSNQGGWDLSETWPNKRNGTEDVTCFDCHNSHGSSVDGSVKPTTSYATNGGILKDIEAGKGGYSLASNYKPQVGGSIENKNEYSAGAGLCFDCHLTADGGTSMPWGYNSTFGATQAISGYKDTPYFGAGTSNSKERLGYKIRSHSGGHFGASSALSGSTTGTINGLCTPCHDPHGVSPTLGGDEQYGVPLLKGTWLTSPYREDSAPIDNVVGTGRTDKGKEGVKFYIDQNTFGSVIWDNAATGITETGLQFAGLCLRCHPQNLLTGSDHTWKSKDRIHESVKGWKTANGTIEHNYPCSKCHTPHNSRLPRLMVTNCLDNMHKGRVGKNPSPINSGNGSGSYVNFFCQLECSGQSATFGGCYCTPNNFPTSSGSGGGYMPGFWYAAGKHVEGGQHVPANTCHKSQTGSDTDQSWNNLTQWADGTLSITKGPEAGSFKAVAPGPNVQATIIWETGSQDSTSYVDYGLTNSYGSNEPDQPDPAMVKNHSITLTDLTNHLNYHYKVSSTGYWGSQAVSGDNTFYISVPPSIPGAQFGSTLCSSSSCPITLKWNVSTDPDSGPIQYYVEVGTDWDLGNISYVLDWTSEETNCVDGQCSWTFNAYRPENWYYWRVKARDGNHAEAVSDWGPVGMFTIYPPPDAPTLIHKSDIVSTEPVSVTFEWIPPASPNGGPLEYFVQVNNASDFNGPNNFTSNWISEETHCDWDEDQYRWTKCGWPVPVPLDTGTKWYWRVQARVSSYPDDPSQWSTIDSFTIMRSNPPPAPTLIDEPNTVSTVPLNITFQWIPVDDPDGDDVDYYVEVSKIPFDQWNYSSPDYFSIWLQEETYCDGTQCSWAATVDPAISRTWYWRVRARDRTYTEAESAWATPDTFIIMSSNPPPAPTLIDEPNYDSGGESNTAITLEWNRVTDPDGDPVEYYLEVLDDYDMGNYAILPWITETVDSAGDVGEYASIGREPWSPSDEIISYYDSANGDLKYATNAHGLWNTETVDSGGDVGKYSSIALDYSDNKHISYYDATNGALKYATNASGSWVTETVDSGGDVGKYSSIAIKYSEDSEHGERISYYDATNGALKYATNASGSWDIETIDSGGVGEYSSIAVDWDGYVYISYYDSVKGDLKYATNASGSWVTETVDSSGDVGKYSSIALDDFNYVHISYYDATNGALKYATNFWDSWDTETVDSGNVGEYTAIGVDWLDYLHISYYDATNGALKHATNLSGSWVNETIDSGGDVGKYSSIKIKYPYDLHISYYDFDNKNLKYANPSGWIPDEAPQCVDTKCSWTVILPSCDSGVSSSWSWRVKARDAAHKDAVSPWSDSDIFYDTSCPYEQLDPPILIPEPDVISTVPVDVTLEWARGESPNYHTVEYWVEVDDNDSFASPIKSEWINEYTNCDWEEYRCNWTITLPTGYTWHWRVKARDRNLPDTGSQWSTIDSFYIMRDNPPPVPTLIDETDVLSTVPVSVELQWNAVIYSAPVEYNVEVDDDIGFGSPIKLDWTPSGTLCVGNVCNWTVPDTLPNGCWYWRVQARNANDHDLISSWSTVDPFAIYAPPPVPTLTPEPDIVSTTSVNVTLQWNSVTGKDCDPVQYMVQGDDDVNFGSPTTSSWMTGTSWTISAVPPGSWYWRVKARDSVHTTAESSWSTVDSFAINVIDESFENPGNPGYDNAPWTETGNPNENSALPASLTGAGSQCLQSISASTASYRAFTRKDLGSGFEQTRTFTSFYLYIESEGLVDGNYKRIGALQNSAYDDVVVFRLNKTGTTELRLYLRLLYNNGSSLIDDYVVITTGNWHRIEVKYDNSTGTAYSEWWFDGVYQGGSTLIPSQTHYSGIQRWELGFGNTGQTYQGTIDFDLIKVNTMSYQ